MIITDAERLYQLLPAVYRLRDAERGYPLRELVRVLADEAQIVEADIARLYENWFIETCEEWVVPYLGDLLGVRGLLPPGRAGWSQRALVANTLRYRQRKGTVPLLEQIVHDVTGWAARAVEMFTAVGTTQYLAHVRPAQGGTANMRDLRDNSLVGSAFDPFCYTADVRIMSGTRQPPLVEAERPKPRPGRRTAGVGKGRPNLPNVGLYIWRLRPYHMEKATAFSHGDGRRFSFNPLGNDLPLFNCPVDRRDFSKSAQEHELPLRLRTERLAEDLEALRRCRTEGREPKTNFFGEQPAFEIYLPGTDSPVDVEDILVRDLSDWGMGQNRIRGHEKDWGFGWELLLSDNNPMEPRVVVDPEHGRILLPGPAGKGRQGEVRVSYTYAFSDDIGGGPYDRRAQQSGGDDMPDNSYGPESVISIPQDDPAALATALQAWPGRQPAVVEIAGNGTHRMPAAGCRIDLKGSQLIVQGANRCRPVLTGNFDIRGKGPTAEITLKGLLVAGQIRLSGVLGKLRIVDCTCVPGTLSSHSPYSPTALPAIIGADQLSSLEITIERSIVGPLILPSTTGGLFVSDSIIDGRMGAGDGPAVAGDIRGLRVGPPIGFERVTAFGNVYVREILAADDALFTDPVNVQFIYKGKLTRCCVPSGSRTPQRESCVGSETVRPSFTSTRHGDPAYGQLSLACPAEIRTGGKDGAEIGAFQRLHQPQREAALLAQLEEYLRFGLEAGLVYVD